jgi:flagellar basal-body rod modification protein FlgD
MRIDATTTDPTNAATGSAGALAGSKDEFLKLFMAQLEHQDPLDPKNGADMVAQLAQFSSVEQAQQTNQHLIELAAAQAATSSASLANLVGRDCNAEAGAFQLDRGAPPAIQLTATGAMKGASVVITDDSGKELRRIAVPSGASSAQITWDGKTAAGVPAAPGSYRITVEPGTTSATITSQWHGRIDAVELTADGPRLRMGGVLLSPADVRTIGLTTAPSSSASRQGVQP